MGKHKKIINNDPILQRDYKYEKRKKLRALQKQAEQQRMQKEQAAKLQLAEIQNQVQQQIQKQLMKNIKISKQKKICKLPKQMFSKKQSKNVGDHPQVIKIVTENKQVMNIKQKSEHHMIDSYANHFSVLPSRIKCIREHKQSRKQIIDREVKNQIKDMFSIKANNQNKMIQQQYKNSKKPANTIIDSQQENNNPYILVKSDNFKQKQIIINNQQLYLFNEQAYLSKQTIVYKDEARDIRKGILQSYKDYVYIQNKQQQTIQQFRKIVVNHMVSHQNRCRKEQTNSKGFTNAKSLILCPFFGDAKSIIQIFQTFYEGYQIEGKQKMETLQQQNDFFRIGISVNDRKKIVKYFTHFNTSNFIIGSPVGIKAIVGTQSDSQRDYSFLSSVQILYVDRASVISMQNWDHLIQVIKSLNMMPNAQSLCNDINKLRKSVPQMLSKIYRQSIIFSQFNFPEINGLKFMHFNNWEGCITSKILYSPQKILKNSDFDINFYKMELKQPKDDLNARFEFFKRKFWEQIANTQSMKKLVIFVRSYFQFISMKQFLIRVNASADFISQHTKKSKVQSKIAGFNASKYRILLLTERAYYYGVCQIKKLQHLYFYSLPRNSFIYFQLIAQIYKQNLYVKNKVVAIYNKYDIMPLQRIVGTRKAIQMVKQYCSNVSFII